MSVWRRTLICLVYRGRICLNLKETDAIYVWWRFCLIMSCFAKTFSRLWYDHCTRIYGGTGISEGWFTHIIFNDSPNTGILLLWGNINELFRVWNVRVSRFISFLMVPVFPFKNSFWLYKISWEGNGNPLHYSCLENPIDDGAWWAIVYGVAQSRTRLKQLSSSSIQN